MRVSLLGIALGLLASCSSAPPARVPASPQPVVPAPPVVERASDAPAIYSSVVEIGTTVEGRPIRMHVLGQGNEVVLVLAGIHGNERACTPLANALLADLRRAPSILSGRTVLVVSDANPDGRVANTRGNAHGVDLNRNFPADNRRSRRRYGRAALSEPESVAIERLVRIYRPARVLSLHQPLACVDHDGPSLRLATRVASASGLPVRKLGTRPGSMGAWLGEGLGVPLITLELPRDANRLTKAALWKRYGEALLVFIREA